MSSEKQGRFLNDTIAAISTPVGEGGIGIVRLSGERSLRIADRIFSSKDSVRPSAFKTYTTHYGHVKNEEGEILDEVILTVMRAPKSYTKEDIVEINCHGGIVPLKRVLELVVALGARMAESGEFTKRAFLNGRIDLSQAEAVLDVIRSKTEASLRVAMNQLEGRLSGRIKDIREKIMDFYSHIEASLDFPEEEIQVFDSKELSKRMKAVLDGLKEMLENAEKGRMMREGIRTVICGKPNVGKSTLMNAFLREDRVIVTHIPGTTRDVIEEVINIEGIPFRIADTAGIIEPSNLIDAEGIKRSIKSIEEADFVLLLLDNNSTFEEKDREIMRMVDGKRGLVVVNKIDLPKRLEVDGIKAYLNGKRIVEISAANGTNLDVLEKIILDMVWSGKIESTHQALITNIRQADAIRRAYKGIQRSRKSLDDNLSAEFIAIEIKEALSALGEITGESMTEDLLDRIFSEFCIGK